MANKTFTGKTRGKKALEKAIYALAMAALIWMLAINPALAQSENEKYGDLEKENISEESDKSLREYYGSLLSSVGKEASFNTISTKEDIAILNVSIDGRDRRIFTKLTKGVVLPQYAEGINSPYIRAVNLTVAGNLLIEGRQLFPIETSFGTRDFFGVKGTRERIVEEGASRLANGMANVTLNPIFAEVISSYNVYLSPYGLTKGLYVGEKSADYFVVKGVNGKSNIGFSWLISGVRKTYEEEYLNSKDGGKLRIDAVIDMEAGTTAVSVMGMIKSGMENKTASGAETTISTITGNVILEDDLSKILSDTPQELPVLGKEKGDKKYEVKNEDGNEKNADESGSIPSSNETISDETVSEQPAESNDQTSQNATISDESAEETSEFPLEFVIYSTDEEFALRQIAAVSGLELQQVKNAVKFSYKYPEVFEDETVETEAIAAALPKGIEYTNGSIIIRLGEQ